MADDKFIWELNNIVGLDGRKIPGHVSTLSEAEKVDIKHLTRRGYTVSGTVNNNSTLDIVVGNKAYDNWIGVIITATRGAELRKWRLDILNDNSSISISNLTSERIGGSNIGMTFTNLYYSSNDITLTIAADNSGNNIAINYKTEVINFNSTNNDFTIY